MRMPKLKVPQRRLLYTVFLFFLALGYWVFAWQLERVDLDAADIPMGLGSAIPPLLLPLMEPFLPRVLRHFIPLILGWLMAYAATVNTLYMLYDFPSYGDASKFLLGLLRPANPPGGALTLTPHTLVEQREESVLLRVGGPGRVIVPVGHVAVTEMNGRFHRVADSGVISLDRFETVHSVFDLRPQERDSAGLRLTTREGLVVTCDVGVTFRVRTGDEPVTRRRPYPFNREAVRKLAYAQTNLPGGALGEWQGAALVAVNGALAGTVANFTLDELLQDPETEIGSHLTIRREVERKARGSLRDRGIELLRVRIGHFTFPEDVSQQYIAHWQTYWNNQVRLTRADGAAYAQEVTEIARAEAELSMIRAIIEGVRQAQHQGYKASVTDVMALRLVDAMGKVLQQSQGAASLPQELIAQVDGLREQLLLADKTAAGGVGPNEPQNEIS